MSNLIFALLIFLLAVSVSPTLAQIPETYTVKRVDIQIVEKLMGKVESTALIHLSSPSSGEILWIKGQGSKVTRGEKIGRVDPIKAKIELKGAKNQLKIAKKILRQKERLLQLGLISRLEFFQTQAQYQELKAKVALLSYKMKASELVSPAYGVILKVAKGPGSMVTPGQELITILPTEGLYVQAKVPTEMASHIHKGLKAHIWTPDGKMLTGRVEDILPGQMGFVNARILPDTPLPSELLNSPVSVEITLEFKRVSAIPSQAVVEKGGRFFVFVVSPQGKLEKREVKLGTSTNRGLVEVLSGLKEGERIWAKRAYEEEYKNIKKYIHKED